MPTYRIKERRFQHCPDPIYYVRETQRVKIDPQDSGKKPGSGKSRVVHKDYYLGPARKILEKLQSKERPLCGRELAFGVEAAVLNLAEQLDIVGVVDRAVPKRKQGVSVGQYLLLAAINKISQATSRNGLRGWIERSILPEQMLIDPQLLKCQNFWDAFDKVISESEMKKRKSELEAGTISEEEFMAQPVLDEIEEGIWENVLQHYHVPTDALLYDTTNFYTFMAPENESQFAQPGKSKDFRDHLRQVGLGVAITEDLGLPIFHILYQGNRHDARLFPGAMRSMVERYVKLTGGSRDLTVVFDKGNNSEQNIALARDAGVHVLGALRPSDHDDLMRVSLRRFEEYVDELPVYRTTKEVFGLEAAVAVTYNDKLKRKQERRFERSLQRLKSEVQEAFDKAKRRPKPEIVKAVEKALYDKECRSCLKVEVTGRRFKRLRLEEVSPEIQRRRRRFGKNIIFTTDLGMTTQAIVEGYHARHEVEDAFKIEKAPDLLRFRPIHCWTDSKIRVYAFICVLALLLLKILCYKMRRAGLQMSPRVLVQELRDIKELVLVYPGNEVERVPTERSTIQQQVYELLELDRYAHRRIADQ